VIGFAPEFFGKKKYSPQLDLYRGGREKIFHWRFQDGTYITHITFMLVTPSILASYHW